MAGADHGRRGGHHGGGAVNPLERDGDWQDRDPGSFPRAALVDDGALLVGRGARRSWLAATTTSTADALAAIGLDGDDPVLGMARFTPAPLADAAWATFGGALWFAPAHLTRTGLADADADADASAGAAASEMVDVDDLDGHRFSAMVQRALDACAAGLDKVVVARRFRVRLPAAFAQVPRLFAALMRSHDDGAPFLVSPRAGVAWLGRSPERLLVVEDGLIASEAVAGTQPRRRGPDDETAALLGSAKDAREHALVVEHLVERLRSLGARPEAGPRGVRQLAHLTHLLTTVRARVPAGIDVAALVRALHPTPALAGRPVAAALELLATLEGFDRGGYGGVVGVVSRRRTALSVGLRGVLVDEHGLLLTVGAGIVAGSTPEREDEETRHKARAVLASLALRARGELSGGQP